MKNLKLHTIILTIPLLLSNLQMQGMDQNGGTNNNQIMGAVTKGFTTAATGLEKLVLGHAQRFERQLQNTLSNKQQDILSFDMTINTHELDWAEREIIASKSQMPLVKSDRLLLLLSNVEKQIAKDPTSIEVSGICKNNALKYFTRYTSELNEELNKVTAMIALLNSGTLETTSRATKISDEEYVLLDVSGTNNSSNNSSNNNATNNNSKTDSATQKKDLQSANNNDNAALTSNTHNTNSNNEKPKELDTAISAANSSTVKNDNDVDDDDDKKIDSSTTISKSTDATTTNTISSNNNTSNNGSSKKNKKKGSTNNLQTLEEQGK